MEYGERVAVIESEVRKLEANFDKYKAEHFGEHRAIDDTLRTANDNQNSIFNKMDLMALTLTSFKEQYEKDRADEKEAKKETKNTGFQWFNVLQAAVLLFIAIFQFISFLKG